MGRGREVTHGMTGTRLYKIWTSMRFRCHNPNDENYDRYGGRGITICKEWDDFETFYAWAMSNGYTEKLTLDRENNDGNYCPENCRWATMTTQQRNKGLHRNNTSGHKGICWEADRRKWKVAIMANHVLKNIGRFSDLNDAIAARKQAELDLWGDTSGN